MKPHLIALPLLAVCLAGAVVQIAPVPPVVAKQPSLTIDPAAQALLDRAGRTYFGASGISYDFINVGNDHMEDRLLVRYCRPDQLRIDNCQADKPSMTLYNGSQSYVVRGVAIKKRVSRYGANPMASGAAGMAGQMIGAMMEGKSPTGTTRKMVGTPTPKILTTTIVALEPREIDGELLSGVEETTTVDFPRDDSAMSNRKLTSWFGGSPFALRRVEVLFGGGEDTMTDTEILGQQQLSPKFPPGTFVLPVAGLKKMEEATRP